MLLGCQNEISEADKQKATELHNLALDKRMSGDLEEAKSYYLQAFELDNSSISTHSQLISIYIEQDSIGKAFDFLERVENKQNSIYYFQTKAGLYQLNNEEVKASEYYKKAFGLFKLPSIEKSEDLFALVSYATLETLSGNKEKAVERLNNALKIEWLSQSDIEYLTTMRNECEFYSGDLRIFDKKEDEIVIKTTNLDNTKAVLIKKHVNISGTSSSSTHDTVEIRISPKFKAAIEDLK